MGGGRKHGVGGGRRWMGFARGVWYEGDTGTGDAIQPCQLHTSEESVMEAGRQGSRQAGRAGRERKREREKQPERERERVDEGHRSALGSPV